MAVITQDNALTADGLGAARLPIGGNAVFTALEHDQAGNATYVVWNGAVMTLPTGTGYAVGCMLKDLLNKTIYINFGTTTVAAFVALAVLSTSAQSFLGNVTIATTKTLAVTDADKLTVGGVIVPQQLVVPFSIQPHASLLTYTLFYARAVGYTVTGVGVVMDLVDDTAITASICKCTGNNIAAAATTPLHTGTFNMQTTAGTPQPGTLTSTGADLVLAATDKIGIIFSGVLDVGVCSGWITLKRS